MKHSYDMSSKLSEVIDSLFEIDTCDILEGEVIDALQIDSESDSSLNKSFVNDLKMSKNDFLVERSRSF